MLQSPMPRIDLIFPRKVGRMTYEAPEHLAGLLRPGALVAAELGRAEATGILLGPAEEGTADIKLKTITSVKEEAPGLSAALTRLIAWSAEYYICLEGLVLKSALPAEFFKPVKARKSRKDPEARTPLIQSPQSSYMASYPEGIDYAERMAPLLDALGRSNNYSAFLVHAGSRISEIQLAAEAASALPPGSSAVILAPDLEAMRYAGELLQGRAEGTMGTRGMEIVYYHSGLSGGQRTVALSKMQSPSPEAVTVVLGSLNAVYAPLPRVDLLWVLSEESTLYKAEATPRYNARDVAVMRAYLETSTVVLSSLCPSLESWHNAATGKYTLLDAARGTHRPKVKVVDMRKEPETQGPISRALTEALKSSVASGQQALIYINRKGYSMLECSDCGYMPRCKRCGIPLTYQKAGGKPLARCNTCGTKEPVGARCPECKGAEIRPVGAGIERVEDALRALDPIGVSAAERKNIKVLLDRSVDSGGPESEAKGVVAVGTRTLTRAAALTQSFGLAGIVAADAALYIPDFRARERAYQDFVYSSMHVVPGGLVVLQSRLAGGALMRSMQAYDFRRFYSSELRERKTMGYPPFGKLAALSVEGPEPLPMPALHDKVEVFGPAPGVGRGGKPLQRVLFRASTSKLIGSAVRQYIKLLGERHYVVDVDPVQ